MTGNSLGFDIFISYRRESGETLGRLFFELLKEDYKVFFDHESLSSGRFDTKLLDIIDNCSDTLFILSKGCFDRCSNPGDWFMQEISCALDSNRNIILLMSEDFVMPSSEEAAKIHPKLASFIKYNGYKISVAYIDGIIAKLHKDLRAPIKKKGSLLDDVSTWRSIAACLEDKEFTSNIPKDVKNSILTAAVNSCLGEYNGAILNSMINKSFRQEYNIRPKYRYEISINKGFSFSVTDTDDEKYYELSEAISYSKKFICSKLDKEFWLSFVTNPDMLDSELKAENFFFSENLMIDSEDLDKIISLDPEDLRDFYTYDMRTKININGKILIPVDIKADKSGIFARYVIEDEIGNDVNVKIRFRIPQKKTNCYFFASINDPTFSPFIRFSYPEDELSVTMIPFLSRAVTAEDTKIFDGLRELNVENEWVMPVSGAVFIITEDPQ